MRLGFVGVGPWAQKLATAFRECGAEVVAHDRQQADAPPVEGFGRRFPWQGMISATDLDAIILCAPPSVTTEVALACAKAGKRCVATKPLMLTEEPPFGCEPGSVEAWGQFSSERRAGLYVDLWRLYSPAWLAMKEELRGKDLKEVHIGFCGNGPHRTFSGLLDYGPHALAFMYDLLGECELEITFPPAWERADRGDLWTGGFKSNDGVRVFLTIGNGAAEPQRFVVARTAGGLNYKFNEPEDPAGGLENAFYIDDKGAAGCSKAVALRRFCRAFMAGEASRTLEYSVAARGVLERIVNGTGNS